MTIPSEQNQKPREFMFLAEKKEHVAELLNRLSLPFDTWGSMCDGRPKFDGSFVVTINAPNHSLATIRWHMRQVEDGGCLMLQTVQPSALFTGEPDLSVPFEPADSFTLLPES